MEAYLMLLTSSTCDFYCAAWRQKNLTPAPGACYLLSISRDCAIAAGKYVKLLSPLVLNSVSGTDKKTERVNYRESFCTSLNNLATK